MSKDRYYGSGVEKALFMISRGTCYEPTCKTPVLRMTKTGTPRVNVQIAHIYPLGKDEARFDEDYPRVDLNKFKNLLLLCQTHHTEVDSELWEDYYQAEVLIKWKRIREGDLSNVLGELPPLLDDEQFQDMLIDAISRMRDEIITAIDRVAGISQETLTLLKELVIESFTRPYLSEEAVASLEYSARVFDGMGDQTMMLYESARGLRGIEDHAWMLRESSHSLREIPEYVIPLLEAARNLNTILPDHVAPLADAANKLRELPDHAGLLLRVAERLEAARLLDAIDRIDQIAEAAQSMQTAAQNMGFTAQATEEPTESWSWKSFRLGAGACFLAVVVLLIVWTVAIK